MSHASCFFVVPSWFKSYFACEITRSRFLKYHHRPMEGNPRQSWILDFTLWIPDPKIGFQNVFVSGNLDSGFKSLVGFQTPWAVFRIPQAKISRTSNFLTWGDKQLGTAKKQTDKTRTNSSSTTSKWSIFEDLWSRAQAEVYGARPVLFSLNSTQEQNFINHL